MKNDRFCPSARRSHRRRPCQGLPARWPGYFSVMQSGALLSYRNRLSALEQEVAGLSGRRIDSAATASPPLRSQLRCRESAAPPDRLAAEVQPLTSETHFPRTDPTIPEWISRLDRDALRQNLRSAIKPPSSRPSPFQAFLTPIQDFLAGGSLLVKTGIIILFVGVSFHRQICRRTLPAPH